MKKIIFGFAALALLASAVALAAPKKPVDYRRTLFVPLGQDMLMFEAPLGMCFLDSSDYIEGSLTDQLSHQSERRGKEVFLATFSPCGDIANFGMGGTQLLTRGTINWANPKIGEKSALERQDYLDRREATLHRDVETDIRTIMSDPGAYKMDGSPRRTDNGVLIAFSTDLDLNYEKYRARGVFATTTIRHYPIEVVMLYTEKGPQKDEEDAREKSYAMIDKFLAQQIALNE